MKKNQIILSIAIVILTNNISNISLANESSVPSNSQLNFSYSNELLLTPRVGTTLTSGGDTPSLIGIFGLSIQYEIFKWFRLRSDYRFYTDFKRDVISLGTAFYLPLEHVSPYVYIGIEQSDYDIFTKDGTYSYDLSIGAEVSTSFPWLTFGAEIARADAFRKELKREGGYGYDFEVALYVSLKPLQFS